MFGRVRANAYGPQGVGRDWEIAVHPGKDDDKYATLLLEVIGNGLKGNGKKAITWDQMFQIAAILKTNGYSEALFMRWASDRDDESTALDLFHVQRSETYSIYGLQTIARAVNLEGYLAWLNANPQYERLLTPYMVEEGDMTVARFVSLELSRVLVCSPLGGWYACDPRTNIWQARKDVSTQVVGAICAELDWTLTVMKRRLAEKAAAAAAAPVPAPSAAAVVEEEGDASEAEEEDAKETLAVKEAKLDKMFRRLKQQMQSGSRKANVMSYLRDFLVREDADKLFLPALGTMAFQNGIYWMESGKFQYGIFPDQYVCVHNQFLYKEPTPHDLEAARHELLKILNHNETHLAYMLSVLGYSLTGMANRETGFWYLRGQTAANGKSTLFDILKAVFPVFVGRLTTRRWTWERIATRRSRVGRANASCICRK